MGKIKIILVDDHRIVRDGIKSLLSNRFDIEIIGEASDAYDFFEILKTNIPDVVLLDIALPKISGIEVAKRLKNEYPQVKILMLSMYTSEDFIFNALKAGVHGYLPKNTTQKELLLAVNKVFNGHEYFSKCISDTILKSYIKSAKQGNEISDDKLTMLTGREREILHYVIDGMNNSDIAKHLCISIRTVETHKSNIMRKLNLNSTVELVKFALKNKLIEL